MSSTKLPASQTRRWLSTVFFLVLLSGLLGLTAWNVTRSTALEDAQRAYIKGDLVSSLRASLDHLNRRPWSRDAVLLAARCLSRLDYSDEAEPYFRRAGKLSLDDQMFRAYGLVRGNHRERAIQAYEAILKQAPRNVTALRLLAGVQMTQSNDLEVLRLADRLIAIPEGEAIGYTLRGVIQHNLRNREESVEAFEHVLKIDPDLRIMPLPRKLFWGHLAYDLLAIGRPEDVRRYMTKVLENDPDAYLMNALGRSYYLEGDLDEAERCFRRAVELDPKDFAAHLSLGKIQLHRKDREEAMKELQLAMELGPGQYDAIYTLAMAYRQFGQDADADRLETKLEKIRETKPAAPQPPKAPLSRFAL